MKVKTSKGIVLLDDNVYEILKGHNISVDGAGYARIVLYNKNKRKDINIHRLIMKPQKGEEVDHINGNKLDNRFCNLRVCSIQQNRQNQTTQKVKKLSRFKGVTKKKNGMFQAQISHNKKNIFLGNFHDEIAAAKAYDEKAQELFGEYAKPNIPYPSVFGWLK